MRWERKEEKSNKFSSYLFNLFPHPPVPCHRVPIPQVLVSDTRGVGGSSHKMLWQVQSLGTWWHCGRAGDQPRELRLCWAKGCPEPESDVDQEDEGDLASDVLLLGVLHRKQITKKIYFEKIYPLCHPPSVMDCSWQSELELCNVSSQADDWQFE